MPRLFFDRVGLRNRVAVIPHGIPVAAFSSPGAHGDMRRGIDLPPQAVVIGCVAHLVPVKGHPTLLRAVAQVPEVHLLVAGNPLDEEYVSELQVLVDGLGIQERVTFMGGVRDVPALLAALDIFVLPTWARWRQEGCPVALLEAMASGRACIATDIPGSRDLIEHERSGLLVPPENVDVLAGAIRRLAGSPSDRAAFGAAARHRVEHYYTIEREVGDHEALYAELLGTR